MLEWGRVGLSLVLPWLAGALWVRLLWRTAPAGVWPLALGYGGLLGLLSATGLLRLQVALGFTPGWLGPTAILIGLATIAGWRLWRCAPVAVPVMPSGGYTQPQPQEPTPLWAHILFYLLLIWLGVRGLHLLLEVWWRPLYPWDAWTTWAVRSRVWTELGQLVPFVDAPRWLAESGGAAYTLPAWHYPAMVSLLSVWSTLGQGGWNETAANLPWLGCGLALALGFYGQARLWGASALTALTFTWLLFSLPLLNSHIALAGYADLWLAAVLGLAVIAFFHWARTGDRRQALLATVSALAGALLKLEGMVWLLLFLPALAAARLPGRWFLALAVAATAAWLAWWLSGGLVWTVADFGKFQLTPERLQIPYLGQFGLGYRGSWGPVVKNLWVLDNWHLLGLLLPLSAGVAALTGFGAQPWQRAQLVWVAASLLALFILFFWTDAQQWAEQYTSINRVFLDFVPALLFWSLAVFQHLRVYLVPNPGAVLFGAAPKIR